MTDRRCMLDDCNYHVKAKGLCRKHYRQKLRGTLNAPRYKAPRPVVGTSTSWPYEFVKLGDDWFRRPTGSKGDWLPIVWPERTADNAPQLTDRF